MNKTAKIACGVLAAIVVVVLAGAAFLGGRMLVRSARGERLLNQAEAFSEAMRFDEAIPLFSAALRENLNRSQRAAAYGDRGWAETKVNRDSDAIRDFNAALTIDPHLVHALLDRGLAYHRLGDFKAAFSDYRRTIEMDPNQVDAYRNRALIFGDQGRWKEAISDMDEAIRCAPSDPRWFVRRGYFYSMAGQLDEALASFESAIRLDPENIDAYWDRAKAFRRKNEPERGLDEVSAATRLRPNSAALHLARGLIYLDTNSLDKAREDFDEAILLRPNYAIAYANRGLVALWRESRDVAVGYETRALSLDSNLPFAYYVRGRALLAERQFKEALADFDQSIAHDRSYVRAIVWRAMTEGSIGNYDASRRDLQEAVRQFPTDFLTHSMLAWFLATCPKAAYRDAPTALREARLGIDLSQGDVYAIDTLAVSYAEAGDFVHAQESELDAIAKVESESQRKPLENRLELFRRGKPYRDFP